MANIETGQTVEQFIPHKAPMILLDSVVFASGDKAIATIAITENSPFYDSALRGVSAAVGIEYMAQCIAMCAGFKRLQHNKAVVPGFLLGAQSYEVSVAVFSEQLLTVQVDVQMLSDDGVASFSCVLHDEEGVLLAQAQMNAFSPDDPAPIIEQWLGAV
ncbi:MAG: hypothetical protein KAG18_04475 [Sinobacterium sp.]|nr:hypothetical protein [Sinobacterium sp.]